MQFNELSKTCYKYINNPTIERVVTGLLGIIIVNEDVINKKGDYYSFAYKECYDWYAGNKNLYENIKKIAVKSGIQKNSLVEARTFLNKEFTKAQRDLLCRELYEIICIDKDIKFKEYKEITTYYFNQRYEEFLIKILFISLNVENKKTENLKIINIETNKQLTLLLDKFNELNITISKELIDRYRKYIIQALTLIQKEENRVKVNYIAIDVYEMILEILEDEQMQYNEKLINAMNCINSNPVIYDNETINKKILKGLVILTINSRIIK